ncbi:hypothetical protein COEREDRAFT_10511 [Coemansia reversa NRRL 1564]|uniref:Uncharacterized protein n=1 Tax=Coemansia reversa (strain ATCC 12441 / NRRL 1564) TaxID=763665 RepID=A0A2G5B5J4_COERN|nr:hypothetical protein COEREDRAFT_10511 [Coemansia reversa NRRL 1564]|eukprot:PIA14313.1 hypothetical protein COEREDRAFT_10511 [Coemansia reversa NRRL 1564]
MPSSVVAGAVLQLRQWCLTTGPAAGVGKAMRARVQFPLGRNQNEALVTTLVPVYRTGHHTSVAYWTGICDKAGSAELQNEISMCICASHV